LFNGNFVFGQTGDETSQPSSLDWWDTFAPYAAIIGTAGIAPFTVYYWTKRQKDRDYARDAIEKNREQRQRDFELQLELSQKEIKLQTDIVAEISELVMKTLVAIMKVEEYNEQNKFYEELDDRKKERNRQYYEEFKVRGHVIQSEIQAYYMRCLKQWNVLMDLVQFVEQLSDKNTPVERMEYINHRRNPDKYLYEYEPLGQENKEEDKPIFDTLLDDAMKKFNMSHKSQPVSIQKFRDNLANKDIETWYEVKHAIVDGKDKIIKNILGSKSPLYHLNLQNHR